MKIIVTNPDTIFGEITKHFDNQYAAMDWVKVCLANHVKCVIEVVPVK